MNDNNNQNENSSENGIIAKITAFITFLRNFISSGEESTSGNLLQNKKIPIAVGVVLFLVVFKLFSSSNGFENPKEFKNNEEFAKAFNEAIDRIGASNRFKIKGVVQSSYTSYAYDNDFYLIFAYSEDSKNITVQNTNLETDINDAKNFVELVDIVLATVCPDSTESQRKNFLNKFGLKNIKTSDDIYKLEFLTLDVNNNFQYLFLPGIPPSEKYNGKGQATLFSILKKDDNY